MYYYILLYTSLEIGQVLTNRRYVRSGTATKVSSNNKLYRLSEGKNILVYAIKRCYEKQYRQIITRRRIAPAIMIDCFCKHYLVATQSQINANQGMDFFTCGTWCSTMNNCHCHILLLRAISRAEHYFFQRVGSTVSSPRLPSGRGGPKPLK